MRHKCENYEIRFSANYEAQIPLGSSRHVSTRLDTIDLSIACILAVSSLSNSTARYARLYVERVESCRDVTCHVTSQMEFGLYCLH